MKLTLNIAIILLPFLGLAQTGPGGVGANDGTSTLEYWIDANNGVTGASPITVWSDLSGNGVTNTINGNPALTTNSLNEYSVITFDGSGDYISSNLSINASTFPNLDIYSVYFSDGTTSVGAPWGEDNGGFDRFLLRSNNAGPGCSFAIAHGSGCTGDAALFPASTAIITGVYFAEDVANGSDVVTNGTNLFTFSSNHAVEGSNNFDVGSIGTGGFQFDGDIAETIVFSTNLNSAQRIILYNYLSAKYGIALTSNDVYNEDDVGNGDYDHDVAGIGRIDGSNIHNDAQGTGIVRFFSPSGLGNNEFFFWGHDNGSLNGLETSDVPAGIEARFTRVWRVSERNSTNTSNVNVGSLNMQWDLTGLGAVTASDLRLLIDTDNDGLFSDETPISGATSEGSNVYQFSSVSGGAAGFRNNRRFTLGTINSTQTPLPIELLNFRAMPINDRQVRLEWQTATETNNDFFTIEKSHDGNRWEIMTRIDGAGNSSTLLSYSAVDKKPYAGQTYYRLKQTDFDGQYAYSPVRSVVLNRLIVPQVEIYPNPAESSITIKGSALELEEIEIYNAVGQNVTLRTAITFVDEELVIMDLSQLHSGMYFIRTKTTANSVQKL